MENNITRPISGLATDVSPVDQPKGSYRYALNAVDNSVEGDMSKLTNEKGHLIVAGLPQRHELVGSINMTQNRVVLFSTYPGQGISEIGIFENDTYHTVVNDKHSTSKLNFSIHHQISGIYRLRRGCEDTIYFVDGLSVRYFNFSKPEDFKLGGLWDADLFRLQRTIKETPSFESVTIEDGGNIPPGSYSGAIQYLDEDFNPTEWIISTDTIIVYQDRHNKPFEEIRGSQVWVEGNTEPVTVDKSIRFTVKNLDTSFPYYRIGIAQATSTMGTISKVLAGQPVPTERNSYLFTGIGVTEITLEELQVFDDIIESAEHIKSVDNMLILANTKGKNISYCELQKYASRISVDAIPEEINLADINNINNPKRGTVHFEKVGYQPGEIYALGIVYVFGDGTKSPVFHIPGKSSRSQGRPYLVGAIPMSTNNTVEGTYIDNSSDCTDTGYWGVDNEGDRIDDTVSIRHHRMPTREEANIGFVKTTTIETEGARVRTLLLSFKTRFKQSTLAPGIPIDFVLTYYIGGVAQTKTLTIDDFSLGVNEYMTLEMGIIVNQTVDSENGAGNITKFKLSAKGEKDDGSFDVIDDDLRDVKLQLELGSIDTFIEKTYTAKILGLGFSNIEKPVFENSTEEVVGYYIVRAKRDEYNKTILDTGLLLPLLEDTHYTAFGQVRPSDTTTKPGGGSTGVSNWFRNIRRSTNFLHSKIKKDAYALIYPQFLFNKKEYPTSKIHISGAYKAYQNNTYLAHQITQDVMAGTSYDKDRNSKREKDSDGFDLHTISRFTPQEFVSKPSKEITHKDLFFLDTLFGKSVKDSQNESKEIYNLSSDNRVGIVVGTQQEDLFRDNSYPYVTLKRDLPGVYSDFRVLPYHLDSKQMHTFGEEPKIFSGDSYISSMTFTSSMYYNIKLRKRKNKKSFGKFLLGTILIAAAVVATVVTAGSGSISLVAAGALLSAAGTAASLGFSTLAAGFKQAQANKVYNELYDLGLKDCVDDKITTEIFDVPNPPDDEVQWIQDTLGNLWFESQVNMNWRNGVSNMATDFLPSPMTYNEAQVGDYLVNKLTVFDEENSAGKLYQGFANPEIYDVNKDYTLRNDVKLFTPLGIEYDCCSECGELFPHRVRYSQQSFQEELTDNYRKFLPNNYRDLDGETGAITNLFTIGNNMYVHTEDTIWMIPRNYQERVTDQIVSFLGTGSFFAIPPQKIVDSDYGISAGLQHKWAAVKTPAGYAYISEKERQAYLFNGEQVTPITNGIRKDFYKLLEQPIPDNPLNKEAGGLVATYDPVYERILFTKVNPLQKDDSFTISYSIGAKTFRSYHSYIPGHYLTTTSSHYLVYPGKVEIHKATVGPYQTYHGIKYPYIVDFISVSNPVTQREWNHIRIDSETYRGDVLQDDITFNKAWLYNTHQSSGELLLKVDSQTENDMWAEVMNSNNNEIYITKDNSSWHFNDFRDLVVDKSQPILTKPKAVPILNSNNISVDKPWHEQISFKDKWLGIRLTYDDAKDVKILTNFVIENEQQQY